MIDLQVDLQRPAQAAQRFEAASGLSFLDRNLLARALTHRSFLNEIQSDLLADNERLEFLGDAVLDFLVGEFLFNRYLEMSEGALTNLRASLVRQETLAHFARLLQIGECLLMGRGEADSGGRQRPAILCAAFEAVIGALYLDQGLEAVRGALLPLVEPILPELAAQAAAKDAKSRLQEWSQSYFRQTPKYRTVSAEGPDHLKIFTVVVSIDDQPWGTGDGPSKQKASQEAAVDALGRLAEAEREGQLPPPVAPENGTALPDHVPNLMDLLALP